MGPVTSLHPDAVYLNGPILTMDGDRPTAEAVATRDGIIVAIGGREAIAGLAGPATWVVDLAGRTLLPGFIESHCHPAAATSLGKGSLDVGAKAAPDIESMVQILKAEAAVKAPGTWIQGFGYRQEQLAEQRPPTRWELDRASTQHPIVLTHQSGHIVVANSLALELAAITRDTPDNMNGMHGLIVKDAETGEPNGELREAAANHVRRLVPRQSFEELAASLGPTLQEYARDGVTTIHDAMVAPPDAVRAYQLAAARGELPLRVVMFLMGEGLAVTRGEGLDFGLRTGFGDDRLKIGPVKLIADGSIQGYSGALTRPYHSNPETTGILSYRPEDLAARVLRLHQAGFQVAIHANGDAAIDSVLDAYEAALAAHPRADHRHRIEHCQMVRDDQLERMARLGVAASIFAKHVFYWGDGHRDIFIGPERGARISPLRSAIDRGVRFGLHSDNPITPIAPLEGVWCAVNRLTSSGQLLGGEQRVTADEALRAYTIDAAYLGFDEDRVGSIGEGKLADFVVLEQNPLDVAPESIRDIPVSMTVVGGNVVYEAAREGAGVGASIRI